MRARSVLHVARGSSGASRVEVLRAEAPLLLRESDATLRLSAGVPLVQLVGGAAAPLGGDDLRLDVRVGDGAALAVRSVAATFAQPSTVPAGSLAVVDVEVGPGAHLDWWPEPLVSVRGSDHVAATTVHVGVGAVVCWVDEAVLGRHGEPSGRLVVRQRIEVGGVPLSVHDATFDPDAVSAGRHGDARVAITGFVHGIASGPPASVVRGRVRAARLPLDGVTTSWVALGDDREELHAVLVELGLGPIGAQPIGLVPAGTERADLPSLA